MRRADNSGVPLWVLCRKKSYLSNITETFSTRRNDDGDDADLEVIPDELQSEAVKPLGRLVELATTTLTFSDDVHRLGTTDDDVPRPVEGDEVTLVLRLDHVRPALDGDPVGRMLSAVVVEVGAVPQDVVDGQNV